MVESSISGRSHFSGLAVSATGKYNTKMDVLNYEQLVLMNLVRGRKWYCRRCEAGVYLPPGTQTNECGCCGAKGTMRRVVAIGNQRRSSLSSFFPSEFERLGKELQSND